MLRPLFRLSLFYNGEKSFWTELVLTRQVMLIMINEGGIHLPQLSDEMKGLRRMFEVMEREKTIQLHRVYSRKDVVTTFKKGIGTKGLDVDRVHIVHIAGHGARSGRPTWFNKEIELEAVAHKIKKTLKPRLVFLNYCNSEDLAEKLTGLGVNCVIATKNLVGDELAKDFALKFYMLHLKGNSITQSFFKAMRSMETGVDNVMVDQNRHLNIGDESPLETPLFPYVIYRTGTQRNQVSTVNSRKWRYVIVSVCLFLSTPIYKILIKDPSWNEIIGGMIIYILGIILGLDLKRRFFNNRK